MSVQAILVRMVECAPKGMEMTGTAVSVTMDGKTRIVTPVSTIQRKTTHYVMKYIAWNIHMALLSFALSVML